MLNTVLMALRRLKCALTRHAWDHFADNARSRPGYWWCARCRRFIAAKGPLTFEHAIILRRAGWTDAEIERAGFRFVPITEVSRFMRTTALMADRGVADTLVRAFEDGYVAGWYASSRFGRPVDW